MNPLARLIALCALLLPAALRAEVMTLVADQVYLKGNDGIVAEGNVEALQGDIRLKARKITYSRAGNRVVIDGPIRIDDGEDVVIFAGFADLDADLQDGLIRSARLVLNRQVQLAAAQLRRVDGRYNQMVRASVTSCRVCDDGRPPLWQLRARRVIHDQQEQQLYFHDAQVMLGQTPVLYLPRLRLPDPTLKRARGVLIPSIRSNTALGTGVKIPYFIPLGPSRDITLTPYLSRKTRTMEFRYRQAFRRGGIEFNGAVSDDDLNPGTWRGYLFGTGQFALERDFVLSFDLKAVSDDAYLYDYNYAALDRLDTDVTLARTRRDEHIELTLRHYHSIRAGESNATLPTLMTHAGYTRRYFPAGLGGEAALHLEAHGHLRRSSRAFDGPDADALVDGRDVLRASAELDWQRVWTLAGGVRAGLGAELAFDAVRTDQDTTSAASVAQVSPALQADLRWPLLRTTAGGTTHVLEPMAMLGWRGGDRPNIANDESTRVEFDEGNLLSLARFPAADRRTRGTQAAVGLGWTRIDPGGWTGHLTLGQVWHDTAQPDFTQSSGLSGQFSDLLIAGQVKFPVGFAASARGLLGPGRGASKAEARASWQGDRFDLDAAYVWLGPDAAEARATALSEWSLDARYRVGRHWTTSTYWRYDIARDTTARAGVGLEYRNECIKVDFSVSRRFTSSTSVQPSTDLGLSVALLGFTARTQDKSYARTCKPDAG